MVYWVQIVAFVITALSIKFNRTIVDEFLTEFWVLFLAFLTKFTFAKLVEITGVFKFVNL